MMKHGHLPSLAGKGGRHDNRQRMYVFLHMRNRVPRFTPFYPSHHVFLHTRSRKCRKKQAKIVSGTGTMGMRAQAQSGERSSEARCFPLKVAKAKEKIWIESRIKTDLCGYVRYAGGMKTESSLCECMVNFCIQKIIHIEGTQT